MNAIDPTLSGQRRSPVIALGILILSPWKSTVLRRGLRKQGPGRVFSLVLLALVLITLVSGPVHSHGHISRIGPLTVMQIHVSGGVLALGLAVDHFRRHPVKGYRSFVAWSQTGYVRRFPIVDLDSTWLVTRLGGEPLSPGHGFPARIVAPARRGFWWVNWVTRIAPSPVPWWIQSPFPLT